MRHGHPARLDHRGGIQERVHVHELHEGRRTRHRVEVLPRKRERARLRDAWHRFDCVIDALRESGRLHERSERLALRVAAISLNDPEIGAGFFDDRRGVRDHPSNNAPDRDHHHDQQRDAERRAEELEPVVADIPNCEIHVLPSSSGMPVPT